CDTFRVDDFYTAIPYLDVSTVYDKEAGRVIINVVNRHKDEAITAGIQTIAGAFTGTATVTQILSDDITNKTYTFEERDTSAPKVTEQPVAGSTIEYSFPAHSFTQIVVTVERGWRSAKGTQRDYEATWSFPARAAGRDFMPY